MKVYKKGESMQKYETVCESPLQFALLLSVVIAYERLFNSTLLAFFSL
jgi:hypothetical protein